MEKAPKVLYLQWEHPEGLEDYEGITWCEDQIHDDDIEYVRADEAEKLHVEIERLKKDNDYVHEQLHGKIELENLPAAQALDDLWRAIILARDPNYGDWQYPGQAFRHLKIEYDELKDELRKTKAQREAVQTRLDILVGQQQTPL